MALVKEVRYSEKDIEDWLWEDPGRFSLVDGWVSRQMILGNGGKLDLLGYKKDSRGLLGLVLIELKSNPIKTEDLLQVAGYEYYLKDLIKSAYYQQPTITKCVIGTDHRIGRDILEDATSLDIYLFSANIGDDNKIYIAHNPWMFTPDYYYEVIDRNRQIVESGQCNSLISLLNHNMSIYSKKQQLEDANEK